MYRFQTVTYIYNLPQLFGIRGAEKQFDDEKTNQRSSLLC